MPATQQLSEATQNIGPVYQPLRHDARKSFAPTTEIITENVCYDENPQLTLSQSQWVGVGGARGYMQDHLSWDIQPT